MKIEAISSVGPLSPVYAGGKVNKAKRKRDIKRFAELYRSPLRYEKVGKNHYRAVFPGDPGGEGTADAGMQHPSGHKIDIFG